jgi:23S rRNA (guanosine2251-2'-O)-methyltransferase
MAGRGRGGGDARGSRRGRGGGERAVRERPGGGDAGERGVGGRGPAGGAGGRGERPDRATVVYGRNAVREALRGPRAVACVWATAGAARAEWLASAGVPVEQVRGGEEIERIAGSPDHQGIAARVAPFRYADADALLAAPQPLIVALDEIQDPQNLGAIARTAECAGATGIVLPERRSAEVTAAVCKASAGAVEHLPIAQVRNLADFLGEARAAGTWVYGADGDARVGHTAVDYRGDGVVLVLGSEGRGLRPRVASTCDELVALPLRGRIGSLNVSAAASALLYEVVRQRELG